MIKLYTNHGSKSSRLVKDVLDYCNYNYIEKNISNTRLSYTEIKDLLIKSINGVTDVISYRSKAFKRIESIESLTINDLIKLVQDNPTLLKIPILIDGDKLIVGYDEEELERYSMRANNEVIREK